MLAPMLGRMGVVLVVGMTVGLVLPTGVALAPADDCAIYVANMAGVLTEEGPSGDADWVPMPEDPSLGCGVVYASAEEGTDDMGLPSSACGAVGTLQTICIKVWVSGQRRDCVRQDDNPYTHVWCDFYVSGGLGATMHPGGLSGSASATLSSSSNGDWQTFGCPLFLGGGCEARAGYYRDCTAVPAEFPNRCEFVDTEIPPNWQNTVWVSGGASAQVGPPANDYVKCRYGVGGFLFQVDAKCDG